jgi:hydroxyacylglutathione hydrolase
MTAEQLENLIVDRKSPAVLDVRTSMEFNSGHIEGAHHAPLSRLFSVASSQAPGKVEMLVLVCEHGPRAQLALALLKMRGYKNLDLLSGHMSKWRESGRPLK